MLARRELGNWSGALNRVRCGHPEAALALEAGPGGRARERLLNPVCRIRETPRSSFVRPNAGSIELRFVPPSFDPTGRGGGNCMRRDDLLSCCFGGSGGGTASGRELW